MHLSLNKKTRTRLPKHSEIPEERGEGQECKYENQGAPSGGQTMRGREGKTGSHGDKVDSKDQGNERRGRRGKTWRARQREMEWARREESEERRQV